MVVLPTAARNPFFLAITTPNVVPSGNPQFQRMQDQFTTSALSIAGGPRRGNNYTLDGVSITDILNRAVIIPRRPEPARRFPQNQGEIEATATLADGGKLIKRLSW